jgi:CheY-like chemotaxis protein
MGGGIRTNGARVLVVDDEPKNLIAIEAVLRPLGVEVELANSAADALRMLLRRPPTLLILDVQMPVMDGFEAARLIRERDATRHLPIIFLTAQNTDSRNVFQGYSLGAVDYLFKPFDPGILTSKVMVFVELERRGQRLHEQEIALEREHSNRRLGALAGVLMHYLESADWTAAAKKLLALAIQETGSAGGFLGTLVNGVGVRVWAHDSWHPLPGDALTDDRASVNFGTVAEQPRGPAAIRAMFHGSPARAFDRLDDHLMPVLGGGVNPVLAVPIRCAARPSTRRRSARRWKRWGTRRAWSTRWRCAARPRARSPTSCASRRRWRRSATSRAASRTTSTTCSR